MRKYCSIIAIGFLFFTFSCSNKYEVEISDFAPLSNWEQNTGNIKTLYLDYTEALDSGFIMPTIRQTKAGKFIINFKIKNNTGKPGKFYYKIYYQNESYKFPEADTSGEHVNAYENFYGSWENTNIEFKSTEEIPDDGEFHEISDAFRIVGNPRNDPQFIRGHNTDRPFPEEEIIAKKLFIENNPDWYAQIVKKARDSSKTVEAQLLEDASFALDQDYKNTMYNQRWMRNPRVGVYSFLLVVATEEQYLNDIPDHVKNINRHAEGNYKNPFYFFNYENPGISTILIDSGLKVIAKPGIDQGIYSNYKYGKFDSSYYSCNCGKNLKLYQSAPFEQFFHKIDKKHTMSNIPLIYDINNEEYSEAQYKLNAEKYDRTRVDIPISITDTPCKTVYYDSLSKSIVLVNPASSINNRRKENVGITTRHAFTYGKIRAKVKLPELINKDGIWNGLTNAIWLIYAADSLNERRYCYNGYVPKHFNTKEEKLFTECYSEIDFEIVKTSRFWPKTSYKLNPDIPSSGEEKKEDIIVSCTNWDLACNDPVNYGIGVNEIEYNNQTFILHRWSTFYQALTSKTPYPNNEMFGRDYYYFEIEWKPEEIIWRVGPDLKNMTVVGYMDKNHTSIPNNQMVLVITQEYHLQDWWPQAPFMQNDIPFSATDTKGYIYDITIE